MVIVTLNHSIDSAFCKVTEKGEKEKKKLLSP